MALRSRNAVLLAKVESSEGVDASPTGADNAIKVENPRFSITPNVIQTDEVTGSLDSDEPIIGGIRATVSFDVYLSGSGAAATAPDWGVLLKGCGWAETVTGTAVPSSPEACGAGGSTTVAQLGTSAGTTADAYNGMPIEITSGVTLSSFIADYDSSKNATLTDTAGGTINAGSNYQIPVNVLYTPATASIPTLTLYMYKDGKLYIGLGARGTFTFEITAGGTGKFSFSFSALWEADSDTAVATPTYDNQAKPIWRAGKSRWNRILAQCRSFTLDNGNTVVYPDNPEGDQGFDPAVITRREISGSIDPLETLLATRDILADMEAATNRILHARLGDTAGNRFGITIPAALATQADPSGDRDGLATEQVNFRAIGPDSGAYICHY